MEDTVGLSMRVHGGDRDAFQALYDRVAPSLYAWTQLRLRTGSDVDAQDVLQEVWLRSWRNIESYDPRYSFRGWILAIAKNVLLQSYEGARVQADHRVNAIQSELDVPNAVTSITTRLARDEAVNHFVKYVERLDLEDRQLVVFCGLEEYSCREAAARIGITAAAAEKRWQALRARMRDVGALKEAVSAILEA